MTARSNYTVVAALVALLVLAVVAIDRLVAPPDPGDTAAQAAATEVVGGAWTCPVGDTREGTELQVTAMAPGEVGDDPGQIELGTFAEGDLDLGEPAWVFPGTAVRASLEGAQAAAFARWYVAPVALYRQWQLQGEDDLPSGIAAGPCLSGTSDRWLVPGMSTAGGHEARLRLANPHATDATVAIRLVTPEGPEEPTILQNISVQGHSTTEIEINEHLPERDDVAAEVDVLSGRMAVEGYQLVHQAIGDVNGVSLLASAARPSSTWTIPWVAEDDDRQSWLWVLNPGDRPAPVELTMHGGDGGVVPDGLAEVTVEPGQLRRVDLRGTFPDGLSSAAVTVRSEGVPVVASGAVRIEAPEAEDAGLAIQLGARADSEWVFAGGGLPDRRDQLRLVNPGSEPAVIDVTLWDGAELHRPEDLTGIEVAPGALVPVDLRGQLDTAEGWGAFVEAREGRVVAGHVGQGGPEGRDLVATPALPGGAWAPGGPVLDARREPGLTQRIGTEGR